MTLTRRAFIHNVALASLAVACVPAAAAEGSTRTVHFYGDSISRGYAVGEFEPPTTHPLYLFRSPASMLQAVLDANGIGDRAEYGTWLIGARPLADRAETSYRPEYIREAFASGTIRPNDVVVLEDAGPHGGDPDWYRATLTSLRAEITEHHDVTCLIVSTPDYPPAPPECQWDRPLNGAVSMNQAVKEAALLDRPSMGRTVLIDLDAVMDARRATSIATDGVDLMHRDGIHFNVWGQLLFVGLVLHAAGYSDRIATLEPIAATAAAHSGSLAYGASAFSADRARQYVDWLLLGH